MKKQIKKLVTELIKEMDKLKSDHERLEVFEELTKNYCFYCGSKNTPCYCMNDD